MREIGVDEEQMPVRVIQRIRGADNTTIIHLDTHLLLLLLLYTETCVMVHYTLYIFCCLYEPSRHLSGSLIDSDSLWAGEQNNFTWSIYFLHGLPVIRWLQQIVWCSCSNYISRFSDRGLPPHYRRNCDLLLCTSLDGRMPPCCCLCCPVVMESTSGLLRLICRCAAVAGWDVAAWRFCLCCVHARSLICL